MGQFPYKFGPIKFNPINTTIHCLVIYFIGAFSKSILSFEDIEKIVYNTLILFLKFGFKFKYLLKMDENLSNDQNHGK